MTIITIVALILTTLLYTTTAALADGELAMSAEACIRTGIKAGKPRLIYPNYPIILSVNHNFSSVLSDCRSCSWHVDH